MLLGVLALAGPGDWDVRGPHGAPTGRTVAVADILTHEQAPTWLTAHLVRSDPAAVAAAARESLAVLEAAELPTGLLAELGVTHADLLRTLRYVAEAEPERLRDPAFWRDEFTALRWRGDAAGARARRIGLNSGAVRVTRYLVYAQAGSATPTAVYDTPLYAVPDDERDLSEAEARDAHGLLRHQLTRRQVLDGAFADGGAHAGRAEPLVWLTRSGVHQALLQGTVAVQLPGGERLFTVHRCNDVPWDPSVRDPEAQDRYWYFRSVDTPRGWAPGGATGARVVPGVSLAADLGNLAYGGLVALQADGGLTVGVVSDTGGAFQPNLFQVDLYAGVYPSRAAFEEATRTVPRRAHAWFLVRPAGAE